MLTFCQFCFPQLCVRMDVKMADAASAPTDVHVSMGLPGRSAKEVKYHNPFLSFLNCVVAHLCEVCLLSRSCFKNVTGRRCDRASM